MRCLHVVHRAIIDGKERAIDIRAMDERFIVYRKMFDAPLLSADLPAPETDNADYVVQEFFRRQIRTIGSCMILAWDGDGVIGKMHFTTREMHEAIGGPEDYYVAQHCYCPDHPGFAPKLQTFNDDELDQLLASNSRTLRVLCFNVGGRDQRWHGKGIATAMLEYLKTWARGRGWRGIEAKSCPDITPTSVVGDWILRRGPLEEAGFTVLEETTVPPDEAAERLGEIEAYLSGQVSHAEWNGWFDPEPNTWYARNVGRLASDPVRRSEYDKDYLMRYELARCETDR